MELDLPRERFEGYIFDLDGTLIDTMPLHYLAWRDALRDHGVNRELDEELFYSLGGMPALQVAEVFRAHYGASFDLRAAREAKETRFQTLLPRAEQIDAVVSFAREAAKFAPVSVASGGPRDVVLRTLKHHALDQLFSIVVTADDVTHGKPAPDSFLLAAERMRVAPERCLVFEDAEPGIAAARAAGMQFVRVASRSVSPARGTK
ncbi:HAD-IA family hydrolase [Horticoccus luteus]|uniref:HAD-IA family hydrolase n=1 Tax=Horticoccus luteus TaxID=2862869 RepID=A0A8F9XGT3_9BACT|nr:HAD-IA family hydrolase [Horticoccus luteus]QYM78580.1 HAD-IA family hydrolase [Horticoccus luteus]